MIEATTARPISNLCLLYMQNLELKDTIQKIQKTKSEIKKELEESTANGGGNENADIQQKAGNRTTNKEDAAKVIQEFEESIKNKKSDIVWLAYYQGKIFQKFREQERFVTNMVLKFHVSKSTIVFKIALKKLIDYYSRIIDSSLSLHYFKKNLRVIREICKENVSEFKQIIKFSLNLPAFSQHGFVLFCLKF